MESPAQAANPAPYDQTGAAGAASYEQTRTAGPVSYDQGPPPWPGRADPAGPPAYQPPGPPPYQPPAGPGPAPYQAVPTYGPPSVPPSGGRRRSGMPLLLGVVALAAAVGVGGAVLIVPRLHHSAAVHRNSPATVNSSPAAGAGTGPASPATVTPPAPSSREQAAKGLSGLLAHSVTDRSSIVQAVGDVSQCGPSLGSDARTLDNAAASRQDLLGQLQNLPGRSALPSGMLAALTGAWQHSMEADRDYAQWARDEQSRGCTQNDQSDSNYQAASGPDRQATTGKQSFVAQWNPIATQYNLQTYQWDQL